MLADVTLEGAREEWRQAQTFGDLCKLMARFLEGSLPFSPGYGAPGPDDETAPLVPVLAALNRAGLLTLCSQPGKVYPGGGQRALVDGVALESVARRIARVGLFSDLYTCVVPPGYERGAHLPVTAEDFHPFTWAGETVFNELEHFDDICSQSARAELARAWSVSVIDLQWGRTDYLWDRLAEALCYSENPNPDCYPDDPDFVF